MTLGNFCSRQICMGGVGFLLVIMGLMFGMFWTEIFTYMFGKEAALTPTSKTYEGWKTPPFPLSFDIYFFNWTNPEDIYNHSTKPILEQMGPYRFTERPDKVDIVFHPENHTVSYKRKSDFWFDEEGSVGSLEDEVTILNAVAISAAAKSKYWGFLRQKGVDVGLKIYNQPLAVTKTVDELLFTGYEDDMITIARDMPIFGDDVEVPFDRFGWFYTRNGSADLTGTYNVFTGTDDISKIGKIHEWNFKKHSGFFKDHCGQINGSAGEFYPPNLQDVDSISMFSADLCRSIDFDFEKAQEIDGILGFKYAAGKRSVDNGTEYPEMKCFCGDECVPSGVMNISSCRFGTPVFMSYPHFYGADEFYLNQVEGLSPDESKHQFYMTLEPNTGVPLEVAARLQLNMLIEEFPNIGLYKGVKKTFLPLLWFEQKVRIPEELASELQIVPTVITIGHIAAGVIFAMGFIMLCWLPTESYIRRRNVLKPTTTLHQSKAPHSHIKSLDPETGAEMKKSPEVSPLIETSAVKMVPMKQPEYCDENTAQKS